MRPIEPIPIESSLQRAAGALRSGSLGVLPIQDGTTLIGVVTERSVGQALADGCDPNDSLEIALVRENFGTIQSQSSGADALRRFAGGSDSALLVLDSSNRLLGGITASDLYPRPPSIPRPPAVGGMATPFGVYLTTGGLGAGVPRWALVSTGVLMFCLVAVGTLIEMFSYNWAAKAGYVTHQSPAWDGITIAVLFIGMRMLPLAGIHAAEHKVVHAIERGEPLVPEVVARMPRIHPRCGTNLWAGSAIFTIVFNLPFGDMTLKLVAAAISTLIFWRPFGSFMQWILTTKPPNRKQIEMGIRSGKDLLEKYRVTRGATPSIYMRIWNSGMLQVLGGFAICQAIVSGVAYAFHLDLPFTLF
jgi:CBS domain-containing protein